jgi:hypothetical protein
MKIRLLLPVVALAISFASPASTTAATQETTSVDPEVRQQIEAVAMKFVEAYNKHDAAALAAGYTADAVEVRSWATSWNGGTHSGQQAIEKMFETDFRLNPGKMVNKLVQLYPIANEVCAIANRNVGTWKGYTVTIYVRALDPDTWKVHMTYVNELPP